MGVTGNIEHRTVLVGPSYLPDVGNLQWHAAEVRYLQKYRIADRPEHSDWIFYDLGTMKAGVAGRLVTDDLAEVILALNRDINCYFVAERERTSLFDGTFLAPVAISTCAQYAWSILKEYKPDLVVFHNHPHELFTYVLLRIALLLNIDTLLVHFSALPWRMCVSRYAKDGSIKKLKLKDHCSDGEASSIKRYMRRMQSTHDVAIPALDVNLLAPAGGPLYFGYELSSVTRGSVFKNLLKGYELSSLAKGSVVKNLVRVVRKASLYRAFKKCATSELRKPYVALLLHYQPEEATIPRGGIFGQQFNAILKLRSWLPPEINILVKENRATFRAPITLATGVRNNDFYAAIASLPGTCLVPLETDTFKLIDDALAVATITGSVGLEALCRGKKVLVFGDANYKDFAGVLRLDLSSTDKSQLQAAIADPRHDPSLTERDLLTELLYSIGPAEEANETNFRSQQGATIEAFELIAQSRVALEQ